MAAPRIDDPRRTVGSARVLLVVGAVALAACGRAESPRTADTPPTAGTPTAGAPTAAPLDPEDTRASAAPEPAPEPVPEPAPRADAAEAQLALPAAGAGRPVWGRYGGVVAFVEPVANERQRVVVNGEPAAHVFDRVEQLELARDGATPVYVGVLGQTERLVVGDALGPTWSSVHVAHDGDAPEGLIAYRARTADLKVHLVVGGGVGPAVEEIEEIVWLPDGTPAYRATRDGAKHVVIGADLGPPYRAASRPRAATRVRRVVYAADDGSGTHLWIDRTRGPAYDDISELAIDAAGQPMYEAQRDGATYAVIGSRELGPYARAMHFVASADGARHAFAARRGDDWFVVVDGVEGPAWPGIDSGITFSPDGAHVAYASANGLGDHGPVALVQDGEVIYESASEAALAFVAWSADSRHVACVERAGRTQRIIVDGVPGPTYARAGGPRFLADGTAVYEAQRDARWCLVRGARETCWDDVGAPRIIAAHDDANFVLDARAEHVAYRARDGRRWRVVVDDTPGPEVDGVFDLRFHADGRNVGWGALIGDAYWWKVTPVAP